MLTGDQNSDRMLLRRLTMETQARHACDVGGGGFILMWRSCVRAHCTSLVCLCGVYYRVVSCIHK